MAITDENGGNGFYMPVAPAYGAGGYGNGGGFFGGDWAWIILLLLIGGNGWGMGGFGMGGMMPWLMGGIGAGMGGGFGLDYLYPWLNNSQHISDGFRDQQIGAQLGDIQLGIAGVNQNICQTGNGIVQAINNGFSSAEIAANGRQIAGMQQNFALQTQLADCCCKTQTGIADLKYTVAAENCADRTAAAQNTRDIIDAQTRGTQAIIDKLCQLELDGYKRDNDQLRSENSALKNQNFIAAEINQQNEIFYNRLKNCPVNAVPVAGNTPLFNCNPGFNSHNGCGCGNGGNFR